MPNIEFFEGRIIEIQIQLVKKFETSFLRVWKFVTMHQCQRSIIEQLLVIKIAEILFYVTFLYVNTPDSSLDKLFRTARKNTEI